MSSLNEFYFVFRLTQNFLIKEATYSADQYLNCFQHYKATKKNPAVMNDNSLHTFTFYNSMLKPISFVYRIHILEVNKDSAPNFERSNSDYDSC